jgi:hypothetical protein
MAGKPKLNPEVLHFLRENLGKKESTIRSEISRLKRKFKGTTLNAIAQVYAEQNHLSVLKFIGKTDKETIPNYELEKPTILKINKNRKINEKIKDVVKYETNDHFLKKHIEEINKAYTRKCFTCVFILARKVFENLVIQILKQKYPPTIPQNRDLYFDIVRGRNKDFSDVLDNLYKKRTDFIHEKKEAIERLNQKLKPFKKDANDKVHSLYHIVENAKEIDDLNLDTIIELFKVIN